MNIDEKNYEEFLIRHVENDLSVNERESLFVFLDKHPEYRRELELFEQSRLVPDEAISYGDTTSLKRSAARFTLNNWLIWSSVAATILVLIYFKFLNPQMTGVNSAALKRNPVSNKSAVIAADKPNASSAVHANPASDKNLNSQNPNSSVPANQANSVSQNKENSLAATQIQNANTLQGVNGASPSAENNSGENQEAHNYSGQNSFSSNPQPVTVANKENENSGNVRLVSMNNIIPAAYVSRKREILISKVPDINYYAPGASANQQSRQGDPFRDLASLFKAAVDHKPISQTSFYQHSTVGKLLATQVVYEHH